MTARFIFEKDPTSENPCPGDIIQWADGSVTETLEDGLFRILPIIVTIPNNIHEKIRGRKVE